jgi:hypothetical protein
MKKIILALVFGTAISFSSVALAQNDNSDNLSAATDTISPGCLAFFMWL